MHILIHKLSFRPKKLCKQMTRPLVMHNSKGPVLIHFFYAATFPTVLIKVVFIKMDQLQAVLDLDQWLSSVPGLNITLHLYKRWMDTWPAKEMTLTGVCTVCVCALMSNFDYACTVKYLQVNPFFCLLL